MKLKLADTLSLPLDAVSQTTGILGIRGSGKSHTASVFAEELLDAGQHVVIIDPTDAWWGLRSSKDGKHPAYPITILGGNHADIPLEPTAGAVIADFVIDRRVPVILSIRHMSKREQRRLVTDFCERLWKRKAEPDHKQPLQLIIDEASLFVPQRVGSDDAEMVGIIQRIVRQGRNSGFGNTLIDQRPATVNKDVLSQVELIICHRTIGPQDRSALEDWIEAHDIEGKGKEFMASLAGLERGEAWVWSPGWLDIFRRVKIRDRKTFDSSATPKLGHVAAEPRKMAEIDLKELHQSIAATIERAKADDPKELRKRIAELERVAPKSAPDPDALKKEFDRGAHSVKRELAKKLREYQASWERLFNMYAGGFDLAIGAVHRLSEDLGAINEKAIGTPSPLKLDLGQIIEETISNPPAPLGQRLRQISDQALASGTKTLSHNQIRERVAAARVGGDSSANLPAGEQAVLTVCAQYYEQGATREQISILTGYKRSTRDAYIQRLREKGLVNGAADRIICCEDGLAALGPDFEPLPTGAALQDYWLARLPAGESKILGMLIAAKGNTISRDSIDRETGFARSSRDAYIQRLKSRQLVKLVGRGEVAASEVLFG